MLVKLNSKLEDMRPGSSRIERGYTNINNCEEESSISASSLCGDKDRCQRKVVMFLRRQMSTTETERPVGCQTASRRQPRVKAQIEFSLSSIKAPTSEKVSKILGIEIFDKTV